MAETMTRKQRVIAALTRQQPDRVPAIPRTEWSALKYIGHTIRQALADPDLIVRSQLACMEELGVEAAWTTVAAQNVLEHALGQKMIESEDDPVAPLEPLIRSAADLEALPKRPNVKDNWWFRLNATVVRDLRKAVGDDACVISVVSSPFRAACMLRGTDNLYVDMYENPDLVKRLVDYCVQPMTDLAEMVADAGSDVCLTACPVASRTMISRKHYVQFVHEMHQRVYSDWERRIGVRVLFHICGDWSDRLDLVADEGVSGVQIDKTDLAGTKALIGRRVAINGNVPTTDVMLLGNPEDVERASIECIDKGARGGGYLLGADCQMARDTPADNVKAMVRAAEKYGVYPSK